MNNRFFAAALAIVLLALAATALLPRGDATAADLNVCGSSDVQFLGFSDALNKLTVGGIATTELSGITYDPQRGVYYVVGDRLGTVPAHVFTLTVPLTSDALGTPSISTVRLLAGPDGQWFTGLNLDGEGIALASASELYVSSEGGSAPPGGPAVYRFTVDGGYLGALTVPSIFQIGVNNLSFEGLAFSPSKRSLFVAMEGPLPADGVTGDLRGRQRILRYELRGDAYEPAQQYFYLTERGRNASELGVSELIALSDTELLVMERGFVANEGNTVRVFKTSVAGASDISRVAALTSTSVAPLQKTLLFDLATCPDNGASLAPGATQPNKLLDNFEAMALGPELPGGRRALILLSDDNSGTNQTTRLIALAVDNRALAPR
jgi:hypothetical protein